MGSLLVSIKVKLQSYGPSNCCSISSSPRSLGLFFCGRPHFRGIVNYELHVKKIVFSNQSICSSRLNPVSVLSSDVGAHLINQRGYVVNFRPNRSEDCLAMLDSLLTAVICIHMTASLVFDCLANGGKDNEYQKWRWKPKDCEIARFDVGAVLKYLRGKRVVFVGNLLSRTQWEPMVCMLMSGVEDKRFVYEANENEITKQIRHLSVRFETFVFTVDRVLGLRKDMK
ncbi:TRICHOME BIREFRINGENCE-LIKE 7 [Perilla frutescens var. hirtella]|nr:TRICHOME BIREFRINGENCE-LIKE 7 [Perilla frutescens var. frutescens]KAH6800093.1 TRICHOME BIREFRINGENCE-LIKE 7 [Perilla frutescens var. hirtella]